MKLQSINEWIEDNNPIYEAFKSSMLKELHKILIRTDKKMRGSHLKLLWNAFPKKISQRPSEIEDNQVRKISGKESKKDMKMNPNALYFYIYDGVLQTILQDNQNVYLSGWKVSKDYNGYDNYTDSKDSKRVRNERDKLSVGQHNIGGNSKSNKTGVSASGRDNELIYPYPHVLTKSELFKTDGVVVYVVESPSDIEQKLTKELNSIRYGAFEKDTFINNSRFKANNNTRYKDIIEKRKSDKRKNTVMDVEVLSKLVSIKPRMEVLMADIFANPAKYYYKDIKKTTHYGTGANRRSYTTTIIELYTQLHRSYDELEKDFYAGKEINGTYEIKDFYNKYNDLDKILKNNKV